MEFRAARDNDRKGFEVLIPVGGTNPLTRYGEVPSGGLRERSTSSDLCPSPSVTNGIGRRRTRYPARNAPVFPDPTQRGRRRTQPFRSESSCNLAQLIALTIGQ